MTMNTIAWGLDFLEVLKIRIFSVFFKKLQFCNEDLPSEYYALEKIWKQIFLTLLTKVLEYLTSFLKFPCLKIVQIRSFFWSLFSRIRAEYGDLLCKSPYSARVRENTDQKRLYIWTLFTQYSFGNTENQTPILSLLK